MTSTINSNSSTSPEVRDGGAAGDAAPSANGNGAPPFTVATLVDRQMGRLGRDTFGAASAEWRALRSSASWAADARAAVVTFLIALPLCLGIAIASGAPPMTGILTGIIGGLVAGALSQSPIMVTAPAAGLAVLTVNAVATLGSFRGMLASLVVAGLIQVTLGFIGAGTLSYLVPLVVIKGMLAAIGFILILKQIPHALGYSVDFVGDESFL